LQFAFETIVQDTVVTGAKLVIEDVPITMHCQTCQRTFHVERNTYICPHCDGVKLEVLTGKELVLAWLRKNKISLNPKNIIFSRIFNFTP